MEVQSSVRWPDLTQPPLPLRSVSVQPLATRAILHRPRSQYKRVPAPLWLPTAIICSLWIIKFPMYSIFWPSVQIRRCPMKIYSFKKIVEDNGISVSSCRTWQFIDISIQRVQLWFAKLFLLSQNVLLKYPIWQIFKDVKYCQIMSSTLLKTEYLLLFHKLYLSVIPEKKVSCKDIILKWTFRCRHWK